MTPEVAPWRSTLSRPLSERRSLTLTGRLEAFAHRGRQAFAVRADGCRGCGLCVSACPEQAITLRVRER